MTHANPSIRFPHAALLLGFSLSCIGCGTFSILRPADTLSKNNSEFSFGMAANSVGGVQPMLQWNYGLSNQIELGAQYEVYSYLLGARYGLLSSEKHSFAAACGLSVGQINEVTQFGFSANSSGTWINTGAIIPELTIGRRWRSLELYLGYRAFFGFAYNWSYTIGTIKLGTRFPIEPHIFFTLEVGETHTVTSGLFFQVIEGTAGFTYLF